jgi:hypothetical protein
MDAFAPQSRQTALHVKIVVIWTAIGLALLGHQFFPQDVSILWVLGIALLSRMWSWPAFPRADRIIWRVFGGCFVLIVLLAVATRGGIFGWKAPGAYDLQLPENADLLGLFTVCGLGFLLVPVYWLVSDAMMLYRHWRNRRVDE